MPEELAHLDRNIDNSIETPLPLRGPKKFTSPKANIFQSVAVRRVDPKLKKYQKKLKWTNVGFTNCI